MLRLNAFHKKLKILFFPVVVLFGVSFHIATASVIFSPSSFVPVDDSGYFGRANEYRCDIDETFYMVSYRPDLGGFEDANFPMICSGENRPVSEFSFDEVSTSFILAVRGDSCSALRYNYTLPVSESDFRAWVMGCGGDYTPLVRAGGYINFEPIMNIAGVPALLASSTARSVASVLPVAVIVLGITISFWVIKKILEMYEPTETEKEVDIQHKLLRKQLYGE